MYPIDTLSAFNQLVIKLSNELITIFPKVNPGINCTAGDCRAGHLETGLNPLRCNHSQEVVLRARLTYGDSFLRYAQKAVSHLTCSQLYAGSSSVDGNYHRTPHHDP
eukprot:6475953-Amphidinium_carterae.1